MIKSASRLSITLAIFMIMAGHAVSEERPAMISENDKDNYRMGVSIVRNLKKQGGVVNLDIVIQGMKDELAGNVVSFDENHPVTLAGKNSDLGQDNKHQTLIQDTTLKKAEHIAVNRQTEKTVPIVNAGNRNGQSDVVSPNTAGLSIIERYEMRRKIKDRAADFRKKIIQQELQKQ